MALPTGAPLYLEHGHSRSAVLADITVNGKPVKAVLESSKQAFLYAFDRVTGQLIWPIEERLVEKGDCPRRVVFCDAALSH